MGDTGPVMLVVVLAILLGWLGGTLASSKEVKQWQLYRAVQICSGVSNIDNIETHKLRAPVVTCLDGKRHNLVVEQQ